MFDVSDEATGLPPLHEVAADSAMFAMHWMLGVEGLVTLPGEDAPVPVKYVSFRGVIQDPDGECRFGQVHIALPYQAVRPFLAQWDAVLDELPDLPDVGPDSPASS